MKSSLQTEIIKTEEGSMAKIVSFFSYKKSKDVRKMSPLTYVTPFPAKQKKVLVSNIDQLLICRFQTIKTKVCNA